MAKTLDEAGVKRLIQEIKGANKNLNTPIPISTEDTPEAKAQNVKNIADYVEKAKAAGIANVNGMAVTCIIDNDYSGVGYLYGDTDTYICGIETLDDLSNPFNFVVGGDGTYLENELVNRSSHNQITSDMLVEGARKPIILTPDTTEVDEETYQKLLSDDVDVMVKDAYNTLYYVYDVDKNTSVNNIEIRSVNTLGSIDTTDPSDYYFSVACVGISKNAPHTVTTEFGDHSLLDILNYSGYLNKSILSPVLQEIDLNGTDADRKAKLDKFETDWKALTGASILYGAMFIGYYETPFEGVGIFSYNAPSGTYSSILTDSNLRSYQVSVECNGTLTVTPLFSHLEAITISIDNTPESKAANVAAIKAYVDNLIDLGIDTTKGYIIPITASGRNGFLSTRSGNYPYAGYVAADSSVSDFYNILILGNGEYYDSKIQSENSSELNTISKKLVPAINEVNTLANNKQDTLTSGTNIKTINNQSLLGSGNIEISAPSITVDTTMSDTSTNPVQNKVIKAYIDGLVGNVAA